MKYLSGQEAQKGDRIRYAGEDALVELTVSPDGVSADAWQLPDGGIVILTKSGQRYALPGDSFDIEDISFVKRSDEDPRKLWQKGWAGPNMGGRESDAWRTL